MDIHESEELKVHFWARLMENRLPFLMFDVDEDGLD